MALHRWDDIAGMRLYAAGVNNFLLLFIFEEEIRK